MVHIPNIISRYAPDVTAQTHPELDSLVSCALNYYSDFVKPHKKFYSPTPIERETLLKIDHALALCAQDQVFLDLKAIDQAPIVQNLLLNVARTIEIYQDSTKKGPNGAPAVSVSFFQMLYRVLLGQEQGPRFGSFVVLYGIEEVRTLIAAALKREG